MRFLAGLPPTSHYVIAKRNDPEAAMQYARALREQQSEGKAAAWRPPALEWDAHAELLAGLLDRLGELTALVADLPIAGKKRKHKPPKRTARPESAVERAERHLSLEHTMEIIADVEAAYVTTEEYARRVAEAEAEAASAVASTQDHPGA
jgi:hypothetical protein